MAEKAKIKVKIKKRKLKIKSILIFLIILVIFYLIFSYLLSLPIKNIYVINNQILSDDVILKTSEIDTYPSFYKTFKYEIKEKLLENDYIKDVKVTKVFPQKIYIEINEYQVLCSIKDTNKIILENGLIVNNIYNISNVPIIINYIDSIYNKMITSLNKVEREVLLKISEIEYAPVEVDNERFILYMNDDNQVYITLGKIESINKYSSIVNELEGKTGILYLDSGNYFEEK